MSSVIGGALAFCGGSPQAAAATKQATLANANRIAFMRTPICFKTLLAVYVTGRHKNTPDKWPAAKLANSRPPGSFAEMNL